MPPTRWQVCEDDVNVGGVGWRTGREYVSCSGREMVLFDDKTTPLHKATVRLQPANQLYRKANDTHLDYRRQTWSLVTVKRKGWGDAETSLGIYMV